MSWHGLDDMWHAKLACCGNTSGDHVQLQFLGVSLSAVRPNRLVIVCLKVCQKSAGFHTLMFTCISSCSLVEIDHAYLSCCAMNNHSSSYSSWHAWLQSCRSRTDLKVFHDRSWMHTMMTNGFFTGQWYWRSNPRSHWRLKSWYPSGDCGWVPMFCAWTLEESLVKGSWEYARELRLGGAMKAKRQHNHAYT